MKNGSAKYCVALSLLPGIGPVRFCRLVEQLGSARAAWEASPQELRACGVDVKSLPLLLSRRREVNPDVELDRVQRFGARVLTWDDPDYPAALRQTYGCPAILYVLGDIRPEDDDALAIVGTRRPSLYGRELAAKVTPLLVQQGLTIVSGLAVGIDTIAHRSALEAGGRTISVLGSGLDVVYPSQNRGLAQRIGRQGAVITEFAMGTQPDAYNFPPRNRIISGLSLGSLIVEAGEKSGALLTANFAVDQNREVFAFPGRVTDRNSDGCNKLIKQGQAKLVTSVEDILDELNLETTPRQVPIDYPIGANQSESTVLALLSAQPIHIDDLGRQAALTAPQITSTVTMLELRGLIRHVGSMHYVLTR